MDKDKLKQYRHHIQTIMEAYHRVASAAPEREVESQLLFDRKRDHYQLLQIGWLNNKEHIFGCSIHVSIKAGKIWIEHDLTEAGIANELIKRGVPKEDIVLAFHAPYKRPYTGFAVA